MTNICFADGSVMLAVRTTGAFKFVISLFDYDGTLLLQQVWSVHSAENHLEAPPNYSVIFIFTVHKTFFSFFQQFAQNHLSKKEVMCCRTESSAEAKWAKSQVF